LKYDPITGIGKVSPELNLLLECLRSPDGALAQSGIGNLFRNPMDWDAFIRLVERHRVVSPVYGCLR
jgi:hypothetical protein